MEAKLKWRLKDLPDANGVAQLVEQKVITQEEARQLLFNNNDYQEIERIKALEKQVEFLEELVRELSKQRITHTHSTTFIDNAVRRYESYYRPALWMSAGGVAKGPVANIGIGQAVGGTGAAQSNRAQLSNYAQKLIG